jgi:adenine phosphoribosyltransferase
MLLKRAAALLRPVPDFPKPGILFWDIAPVLRDHEVIAHIVDLMYERWKDERIDVVAGFDARGFIFGPLLAQRLGVAFEQIRKKGKLPGETIIESYDLEYGSAELEMIADGFIAGKHVLLIDDLLATGGTAFAGAKLVERQGGTVTGFVCLTELPDLAGRFRLKSYPIQSLISILDQKPWVGVEYCVDAIISNGRLSEYLFIERLTEPLGLSLMGGHIENESLLAALARELYEETGCNLSSGFASEHCVLTKPERDPRGVKVSYVFRVFCDTSPARDEIAKSKVLRVPEVPKPSSFVLGHGEAIDHEVEIESHHSL